MSRTITVKGGSVTVVFDTTEYYYIIASGAKQASGELLVEVQKHLKDLLNQPGTGEHHPGLKYRSSAGGRPPAKQTGTLQRAWQLARPRLVTEGRTIGYRLGTALPYAKVLEFGPEDWSRMEPRPYLRPAIDMVRPIVADTYKRTVQRFLSDAIKKKLGVGNA